MQHEGCCVVNPGSFTQEYSFVSHTPADGDVSFSIIGNSYEQVEDEIIGDEKSLDDEEESMDDHAIPLEDSDTTNNDIEPENSASEEEPNISDISEDEKLQSEEESEHQDMED